jgi:hypothetical protein
MYRLRVYKNRDKTQPLEFVGRNQAAAEYKMRQWLHANRNGGTDGLTIFPHPFNDEEYAFVWCETYEEWRIEMGPHPDDADCYNEDEFEQAVDEWMEYVKTWGEWVED